MEHTLRQNTANAEWLISSVFTNVKNMCHFNLKFLGDEHLMVLDFCVSFWHCFPFSVIKILLFFWHTGI
jgi:hypothetical protein